MNPIFKTFIPEGFSSVTPYLMVNNVAALIKFLKVALYAEELSRTTDDKGIIRNCILRMGKSNFMIGKAGDEFLDMRMALYLCLSMIQMWNIRMRWIKERQMYFLQWIWNMMMDKEGSRMSAVIIGGFLSDWRKELINNTHTIYIAHKIVVKQALC